ncbi:MAG TPA: hypothetical protein VLF93_00335 [Candidatus Saccharimonadales bacterium]|nr:hypothetical protein [Candidatus Saccharimonadales bacterium]
MILQELIRNIVMYNGVINPVLQSVKESILSFISAARREQALGVTSQGYSSQKLELYTHELLSGTRTIPNREVIIIDSFREVKKVLLDMPKIDSNTIFSMLMGEEIEEPSKTSSATMSVGAVLEDRKTTGFLTEYTLIYFSRETHEGREYLGEFSLSHEENQLNSPIERG